jgi:hypothetical protein
MTKAAASGGSGEKLSAATAAPPVTVSASAVRGQRPAPPRRGGQHGNRDDQRGQALRDTGQVGWLVELDAVYTREQDRARDVDRGPVRLAEAVAQRVHALTVTRRAGRPRRTGV